MTNHLVRIRPATAIEFLPADMHSKAGIDLAKLAEAAREALAGSEKSLAAAGEIANGNVVTRWWNNNDLQAHVVQAIGYLRDISTVNLGLSAICNDLAEANLERACKNFCVNGHLAGNCRATRSEDDRTQESCAQGATG